MGHYCYKYAETVSGHLTFYSVLGITLLQDDRQGGAHTGERDQQEKSLDNMSYSLS